VWLDALKERTAYPSQDSLAEHTRPGETRYAVAVATYLAQARLVVAAARSIVERSAALAALVEARDPRTRSA
jgi:hypothetical protein